MPVGVYEKRRKPLADRLMAKVKVNSDTGCWEWTGSKTAFGHGSLYRGSEVSGGRKLLKAHRASWEIHRGTIPDGLFVLHKCDVPACINPDHLFLGTKADNSADMVKKGRQKRGEMLPQSRLTWAQVDAIKRCDLPYKEIAALCGVGYTAIANIKLGKSWAGEPPA